jgi:uncharacterized integral membrane protein
MVILFILGLLLGAAAVIFIVQNIAPITVTFFAWQLTGSLAVILMLALLSGVLITLLLILPESIGNFLKYRNLKKEVVRLEEDLRKQKELTHFAHKTPPTSEDITAIEKGAISE